MQKRKQNNVPNMSQNAQNPNNNNENIATWSAKQGFMANKKVKTTNLLKTKVTTLTNNNKKLRAENNKLKHANKKLKTENKKLIIASNSNNNNNNFYMQLIKQNAKNHANATGKNYNEVLAEFKQRMA